MSGYGGRGSGFSRGRGGDSYEDNSDDMFVPASDCGKIIGRGGSKIRELQDQSGCRIKVCHDDEGDGTRRVELSGSDDAIEMARDLISQILGAGDDRGGRMQQSYGYGGGSFDDVISVKSDCVGRIIGKGGSRVRDLESETGCRIKVSRDGGIDGQTDVRLSGTPSQMKRAKQAIRSIENPSY